MKKKGINRITPYPLTKKVNKRKWFKKIKALIRLFIKKRFTNIFNRRYLKSIISKRRCRKSETSRRKRC